MELGMEGASKQNGIVYNWKIAWTLQSFKFKFFSGWIFLIGILTTYPKFFAFIQKREGTVLNDWLLAVLPSADVSFAILGVICGVVLIGLNSTLRDPFRFLTFLWSYLLLNVSRIITITLVPLNPPVGLTELVDPLAFPFYGSNGINKDLFYSGHTASLFMVYLIVEKKWEKQIALAGTLIVGILLLIQHIHYTIDVLSAPVFVFFIVMLANKISGYNKKRY